MGRVETRMYRRKRERNRLLRTVLVLAMLCIAGVIAWHRLPDPFAAENLAAPAQTPVDTAFDQTVDSREVTLAEETWYAIQTGVFSTEEAARQKADAYTDRGAPGTVVQEGEKWRVFIACYAREADAAAVRTRLEERQQVDTYLYAWKCPELRLRLTGMAGQLDAVEAGFTLLISSAAKLRDTAAALDAAQITTGEAAEAVEDLNGQIKLWEKTIRSRFGNRVPVFVTDMLTITLNWTDRYEKLRHASAATELSAALKAQAMGLFDEIRTWRSRVAAQ